MDKKEMEKELDEIRNMAPEEFAEMYLKDTVIPTAKDGEEAMRILQAASEGRSEKRENSASDAVAWFDSLREGFCRANSIDSEDIRSFFQIVGWDDDTDTAFSADITVYFRNKETAEKFAKIIREDIRYTIPSTNYDSDYGRVQRIFNLDDGQEEEDRTVPESLKEWPFSVNWYVDMRD